MRLVAIFFALGIRLFATPAPFDLEQNVTVVVEFEKPYSTASVAALRHELRALFEPTGVRIDLQLKDELPPGQEFNELVIFKMKGACTMTPLPIGAVLDERGPLAMTYTSNGEVLHFGEVECDQVRRSLQRILGRGYPERHQSAFGAALGRIMAHEMYHMIANAKQHTGGGVTKRSLSAEELLSDELGISDFAQKAMQRGLAPTRRP
jgi:hypothetical protein